MKKPFIICMILLFTMGTLAVVDAGWSDLVSANYNVAVGTVEAGIRSLGTSDSGPDPCYPGGPNPEGRDVGVTRFDDGPYQYKLDGKSYSEKIKMDIYGYQSYAPVCSLEMANCGSIPVKLDRLELDWDGDLAANIQVGKWKVDGPDGYSKKGRGLASLRKAIRYVCLDPGQKMWFDLEFLVGEANNHENTLEVVQEALRIALVTKTAEASEADDISSGNEANNSPAADPGPENGAEQAPAAYDSSSPTETPSEETSPNMPADQSGDGSEEMEQPPDVTVYSIPELPVPAYEEGSTASEIDALPKEIKCGSAKGTITITYRPWNENWW